MPDPLDAYNVVWNTQSRDPSESMPCGGGDVGLNVWVEQGELLIYLSRSGTFDELGIMPKLGRLRVRLEPNPFEADAVNFRQELRLREGFVQIAGEGRGIRATIDIWVEVFRPVIHVEISSNQPTRALAAYENWRSADRPLERAEVHSSRSWAGAPEAGIVRRDTVDFHGDQVRFFHRNSGRNVFDLLVEQQGLAHLKHELWNPLENLTYGGAIEGRDFVAAGETEGTYASTPFRAWNLQSASAGVSHELRVTLHSADAPTLGEWIDGLDRLVAEARGDGSARQRSIAWWQAFWDRSHVIINSDQPGSVPWQVGRNFQLFRYQLACNAHGSCPTKFNGGLFTFDPEFIDAELQLAPDFRKWGGTTFTAQNQRLVYWPMLKNGDFDLIRPQLEFYRRALGNARVRAREYFGIDGACFPEQIELFGLPVGYDYGWKRGADVPPGIECSAWVSYQWDTVFEFCQMALELWQHTAADITEYLPLIESCLRFYDEFYQRECLKRTGKRLSDDGKLVIFPGTACETYKNALNPSSTLAALRVVLTRLLQLPESLLARDRREHWRAMLGRVPDLAMREKDGHQTISPAWQWSHKQNCELPQLYPVYPWGLYGVGRPDLQVAIDTWRFGADDPDQKQIQSWHQDAIFCARLGLTDEAAALTIEKMRDASRRFPTFWGPGHDWVPDHNWGGSGMIGVQEMLLQVVDSKLHLLPAWPDDWDVDFKLHAPGQTVVECVYRGGRIERLRVHPEERARDVVVHRAGAQ